MTRVIIIGGGFGGLSAVLKLSKGGLRFQGILFDRRETFDFLPVLPDCIGRGVPPECLSYPIHEICKRTGFKFVREEILSLDPVQKTIRTKEQSLPYDFLLVASGSESNYYGNENLKTHSLKLGSADDARKILEALQQKSYSNYLVAGGGYTGVEAASNLRLYLKKRGIDARVVLIERGESILKPLPESLRNYAAENLKRMGIEILTSHSISRIDQGSAYLTDGRVVSDALILWAGGVKTADFLHELNVKKTAQGRILVDENLRFGENSFAIGDAAGFAYEGNYLRMAVHFATTQGAVAAQNILRLIEKKPLKKYKPIDLGYIVPMANNRSCGIVFGMNLKGRICTFLHFFVSVLMIWGIRNKLCVLKTLISSPKVT